MARKNYIVQTGSNSAEIYIDKLPDCAFVNAIKTVDICTARILPASERAELQRGGPDVEIVSMDGEKMLVTRQQLCSQFTHCSGRVIKLKYLRTDTKYIVYRLCNVTCRVTKLPNNCTGKIGNKSIKSGSFIIKGADNKIKVLSPRLFKKAYKIPLNDVIKRHMHGGISRDFAMNNIYKSQSESKARLFNDFGKQRVQPMQINVPKQPMMTMPQPQEKATNAFKQQINKTQSFDRQNNLFKSAQQTQQNQRSTQPQTGAPLTVTARLVNLNKQLVGFMVLNKATGQKKQMQLAQVKGLSREHKIDNLMLVTKEGTNIQYLRGNGVIIQNLPEILV